RGLVGRRQARATRPRENAAADRRAGGRRLLPGAGRRPTGGHDALGRWPHHQSRLGRVQGQGAGADPRHLPRLRRLRPAAAEFRLNNEMSDFNPKPGVTTRRGLIGTPANQVAPGKRMLSSMTPTIVAKDGKPFLITGSPGSRTIINTVLCVVVNVIDFDMDVRAAVDAP